MEPYKFEKDIKSKLEKRTIKPTANSWHKLESSLESNEPKKGTKVWYLLGIAASVVGILLVVSIFFKKDIDKTTPIIVDSPVPENEDATTTVAVENNSTVLDTLQSEKPINATENLIVGTSKESTSKPTKQTSKSFVDATPTLQNVEKVAVITPINSEKDSVNTTIEAKKIEELITQIEDLKTQTYAVTDNDIDALLKDAQLALKFEKLYTENKKTVDAYKLLQDVEADIDKSMRVKFLETLKLNFENMKTLIAQRND